MGEKRLREVKVSDIYLYFALPLILLILTVAGFVLLLVFHVVNVWYIIAPFVVAWYFIIKYLAIGCVLMYKAFMPLEIRNKCRYTPCCSTYMIIAIKKYGLIIGMIKGICRVCRCKPPNGGIDYP